MTDNRTTELLPCPCCDSESIKEFAPDEWGDSANPYWKIKCMECGLTMCGTNRRMNQEAWNTRTPEHAIAATLGSEREVELVRAMEDVLRHSTDTVWAGEAETLVDRMVSLGVYKHDVYEGARPWEVD